MWFLGLYRFYISLAAGAAAFFFLWHTVWAWLLVTPGVRLAWFFAERALNAWRMDRDFQRHIAAFRQELGPYGIRIANKADANPRVKKSLAEVFTASPSKLKKTVEQLEVMDTLFRAGMRPEGDEYLLHDLKLKYGRRRLERENARDPDTPSSHGASDVST
ncbi:MAG: hypothetical protein GF418_15555 [Chitinivibrionales bacterium]|nr:hypothetical protein [Chitinivibrionales bacterium]MBD3397037.1 hypothetical protein [Chitinivibrionales bacterium]